MSADITAATDYYELLEVPETATPDDIKKAYRRAAMKWHPDRNHGNEIEATRVFQLVEHAYGVLSDEHERAWYDGHRQNDDSEQTATKVDINGLRHASAYFGFGAGPRDFYTVFGSAFSTLAAEDKCDAPPFGDAASPWPSVSAFYDFWSCFTTKRSFAFVEVYNLRDAPNAAIRRAMKQDNEKAKQRAESNFVASVRELAQYVRKRDPRVAEQIRLVEEQRAARRAADDARRFAEHQRVQAEIDHGPADVGIRYTDDDLSYVKQFDEDPSEADKWSCPICRNRIKGEAAFRTHCRSKKHKKAAAAARTSFMTGQSDMDHNAFNFVLFDLSPVEIEALTGVPDFDCSVIFFSEDGAAAAAADEEEEVDDAPKPKRPPSKKERRKAKGAEEKDRKMQEQKAGGGAKRQRKEIRGQRNEDDVGQRRTKSARQKKQCEQEDAGEPPAPPPRPPPRQFICRNCKRTFTSRTKLFTHLEETKHASTK
jgi:DnaJ family protein A protein 5